MIENIDKDKDGGIDFNEFVEMMVQKLDSSDPEADMEKAFKQMDINVRIDRNYWAVLLVCFAHVTCWFHMVGWVAIRSLYTGATHYCWTFFAIGQLL